MPQKLTNLSMRTAERLISFWWLALILVELVPSTRGSTTISQEPATGKLNMTSTNQIVLISIAWDNMQINIIDTPYLI